jgi:hypothetical protein
MSLDAYLRSCADRCSGCGYHVPSQGCRCGGPTDEWGIFLVAVRAAARGDRVHQRDVRPLLRGRIEPKHIGLQYRRAIREGVLVEIAREQSNDEAGRNTNKWEPIYELRRAA